MRPKAGGGRPWWPGVRFTSVQSAWSVAKPSAPAGKCELNAFPEVDQVGKRGARFSDERIGFDAALPESHSIGAEIIGELARAGEPSYFARRVEGSEILEHADARSTLDDRPGAHRQPSSQRIVDRIA